jgi:hypothetical protein
MQQPLWAAFDEAEKFFLPQDNYTPPARLTEGGETLPNNTHPTLEAVVC